MKCTRTGSGIINAELTGEQLKPCPFCGSRNLSFEHTWTASYWIECQGCGATLHGHCPDDSEDYSERDHVRNATSAVDGWNRRVDPRSPLAPVALAAAA